MNSEYASLAETLASFSVIERKHSKICIDSMPITNVSVFGDNKWDFTEHIRNPNSQGCYGVIYWNYKLNNGDLFSKGCYKYLRQTSKELIYVAALRPLKKAQSAESLYKYASDLRVFVNWCVTNELLKFSDLTSEDIAKWILYVKNQESHPLTVVARLTVSKKLWLYREYLSDTVTFDPFVGRTGFYVSGVGRDDVEQSKFQFIPEEVAKKLVSSSLKRIREDGRALCDLNDEIESFIYDQIKLGRSRSTITKGKRDLLMGTSYTVRSLAYEVRLMMASCYVILNFFTGVRASEMLSFRREKIIRDGHGVWIYGEQFKIQHKEKKWMAPSIVYEAYEILKDLTAPLSRLISLEIELRHSSAINSGSPLSFDEKAEIEKLEDLKEHLFLSYSSRRLYVTEFRYVPTISYPNKVIRKSLKDLIKEEDIRGEDGSYWNLHPHQFRKTFVRFMAANQMNIRYLQEHLGHSSMSMTAWYDTDDLEINEGIQDALTELKSKIFLNVLESGQYSGAASESLSRERHENFSGLVSDEMKKDFAKELASEISLRDTGHSYCLSDADNGNCSGVMACMVDIEQTAICKSALIAKEHLPKWKQHWQNHKDILGESLISEEYKAHMEKRLVEVIEPVIKIFTEVDGGSGE